MFKKLTLLTTAFLLGTFFQVQAQDEEQPSWKKGGDVSANFFNSNFVNWTDGGQNTTTIGGILNGYANYKKEKVSWDNQLLMQYGIQRVGGKENADGSKNRFLKNIDNLQARSFAGYEFSKNLYYSFFVDFQSQLTPTYAYSKLADGSEVKTLKSRFLAPATIKLGPGIKWSWAKEQYNQKFLLNFSPVAAKFLIVNDKDLANAGAHGIDKTKLDSDGNVKKVNTGVGASLIATYGIDITKDITFKTTLDLYSNYLKNPQNILVLWNTQLGVRLLKVFTVTATTDLRYNHDVPVPLKDSNGALTGQTGPRTRFAQTFGIGVGFKF